MSDCPDGIHEECQCAKVAALQERVKELEGNPPAPAKEPFYCCKDTDNPCHPIGDYCSRGRPDTAKEYARCERCAEEHPVASGAQRECPKCLTPRKFFTVNVPAKEDEKR